MQVSIVQGPGCPESFSRPDCIKAVKIEGRQRSPAYVGQVTRVWRQAIDRLLVDPEHYQVREDWDRTLAGLSEGHQTTIGAYHRSWR